MKFSFLRLLFIIVVSALLPNCGMLASKDAGLTEDRVATIDNTIIKELVRQNFDEIIAAPDNSKYVINAKINNIPEKMNLDTGASFTFMKGESYSKFFLKKLNVPPKKAPKIRTFTNDIISDTYPALADSFNIGHTVFKPWLFVLSDEIVSPTILGCDFLHFTKAVFICNPGVLLITVSKAPAGRIGDILKSSGYREIDLIMARNRKYIKIKQQVGDKYKTLDSGVFFVPVTFDQTSGYCLIDTGAFMTIVNRNKVIKKFWQTKPHPGHHVSDVKGNRECIETIFPEKFLIGNVDAGEDAELGYVDMGDKDYVDKKNNSILILGTIGVDVLSKYNAVIDFGNHKLYMQK